MKFINFSDKKILLTIILISVVILVLAITRSSLNTSFFLGLIFDDAKEFAETGIITSNFMPGGYSGPLGSCMRIGGVHAIPACQTFVYAGAILFAFWLMKLRHVYGLAALLGTLVVAFHPVFLLNVWRIHDGNLTVLLLLGFLAAGISFIRFRNLPSALLLGVITGVLLTARINTVLLVFIALALFYEKGSKNEFNFAKKAFVFLVSLIVVFSAVNIATKQKPFFFPEHGFYNFFSGTNEYAAEYLLKDFSGENSHEEALRAKGFSAKTFEERLAFPPEKYKELALDYIKTHQLEYAKLTAIKIFTFFRPGYHMPENFKWASAEGLKRLSKIVLALPFFIWLFFVYKTKDNFFEKENFFVFLVILFYAAPFFIANADPRYRFPLDIVFILDSFCRAVKIRPIASRSES